MVSTFMSAYSSFDCRYLQICVMQLSLFTLCDVRPELFHTVNRYFSSLFFNRWFSFCTFIALLYHCSEYFFRYIFHYRTIV